MNFLSFSWTDYTIFVVMVTLSIIIGIYFRCFGNKQQTTIDYLFGGKNMKVFPVAMSLVASTLSGVTLLAMPAEIYVHGTQYMMVSASALFMGIIFNIIYLPVFRKLELSSAFEYLEIRFHKNLRTTASFLFILSNIFYLPIVIYAPSLAFTQVTGFDLHTVAVVMSSICIFYTAIGGLRTVVWTDTLQFSVTLCTLSFVLVMGTVSVGGLGVIWKKAKLGNRTEFFNMNPDPTIRNTFWSVTLGYLFTWVVLMAANPAIVQRFLAVSSLNDSRKVLIIFVTSAVATKAICCFSGLIVYAKYYDCDPLSAGFIKKADQMLPYYVLDVAEQIPGLGGLFVSGLFSTALSTFSTFLNTLSGITYTDFISPFMPATTTEKKASNIMKIITVLLGLVSMALIFVMEKLGTILEIVSVFGGITLGPLLGVFTIGMIFPFANKKGATWGVLISLAFMAFIITEYQISVYKRAFKHPTKPLYTYGCNASFSVVETSTSISGSPLVEEIFWLYRISFHYYGLIGTLVTLIVGLLVSWMTGKDKIPANPDLFSPCVHRFLVKSTTNTQYESAETELQILPTKTSQTKLDVEDYSARKLHNKR